MKHEHFEKISDYVTLTVEHKFNDQELIAKAQLLSSLTREIDLQTEKKKTVAAEYKNKIDVLKAEVKLVSDAITNKWESQDRACELYLDFENKVRIYDDKITGDELKREPFHQSDFEKRQLKMDLDAQIEENNTIGEIANSKYYPIGEKVEISNQEPDENGMYRDHNGNLTDISPVSAPIADALDIIINSKKKGGTKPKLKPVPKNLLGDHYNKSAEFEEE